MSNPLSQERAGQDAQECPVRDGNWIERHVQRADLKTALERKDRLLEWTQEQAPKAVGILDEGFDDVTAAFGLPVAYRKRLRTTNSIERQNEELRRRKRPELCSGYDPELPE